MIRLLKEKRVPTYSSPPGYAGILSKSEGHPSAEEFFEQITADYRTTSLATIYKTLSLLKNMGEVLEINLPAWEAVTMAINPTHTPMSFAPNAVRSWIQSSGPWLVFLEK